MALVDDILAWADGLPVWQSDTLRRLFRHGALSAQDQEEVLALVKEQCGGAAPTVAAIPLSHEDVSQAGGTATVRLTKLDNLENINRFPPGRELNLSPEGLTVVFGENGAGKSGYARILKNACRARVRHAVLPNAFAKARPRPVPSADVTFDINNGEGTTVFRWRQGDASLPELGNVMVYDSACGADYLAREGACEYQPYGLPHLNRLAKAQREMQAAIDAERQRIRLNPTAFDTLKGDHAVGKLIAKLGKDTDLAKLGELATLKPEDVSRMEELARVLGTMNPEPDARAAELLAKRLDAAVAAVKLAQRFVSDRALDEIKDRYDKQQSAEAALAVAQRKLHEDKPGSEGLLPGTGDALWKALFEAAERYSIHSAYPSHAHPNLDVGAKCVLCQTPLSEDAKTRLTRFASYVADDASKNAQEAARHMADTMKAVGNASLNPVDKATLEELLAVDPALHELVGQTTTAWGNRRAWVENCVAMNDWSTERPALPVGDTLDSVLTVKAEALRARAQNLRTALDPRAKAKLEQELAALRARVQLSKQLAEVKRHVDDSKALSHLSACHAALNPGAVSRQMTKLAGIYVTDALATAMNEELVALGMRRKVEPQLVGRTDVGKTMMALKMADCEDPTNQVLSEGEQRAMSLALFLAELRLQDHGSTVVFDDPSTSFDHHHRRCMAQRLALLAKERPVVVFTHDAVFLGEMGNIATQAGQESVFQTVGWGEGRGPGFVTPGLSWETMDTAERLGQVRDMVSALNGASEYLDEPTKERVKLAYTKLRGTIERAVREVFLNHTIRPFSDIVSVESMGVVVGFPPEQWEELLQIYDRCCEATDAHDTNSTHQLPLPHPEVLARDLSAFERLLAEAKKRGKEYRREREKRTTARKNVFPAGA